MIALKYYIKHCILTVFTRKNLIKFILILFTQIALHIFFIFYIFTNINVTDGSILSFSTDPDTPYRLFLDRPRAVIFDNNSIFTNFGINYYTNLKNKRHLNNLQLFKSNIDLTNQVFVETFNNEVSDLNLSSTNFNYYNWSINNKTIENKIIFYSKINNFKNIDDYDINYIPIDSYIDSLPYLLNEILANQIYNNSNYQFQIFNRFRKCKNDQSLNFIKIFENFFSFVNKIIKKLFDLSLYYLSHIFIHILYKERENKTFYVLEIYNFPRIYHFIGNLVPFILIISLHSLITVCIYFFMFKDINFIYLFYMLVTIQFSQYIYFYTLVSLLKKKNVIKMKIISFTIFSINLLFSFVSEFSYLYVLFPPFFMKFLINYFFNSMLYYSKIEENFVVHMNMFILFWTFILFIYFGKISIINKIKNKAFNDCNLMNLDIKVKKDEYKYESKIITIKKNKINLITGDNHSGKSSILKQVSKKINKNNILYVLTKRKGILYNLTLKENIEFLIQLIENSKMNFKDGILNSNLTSDTKDFFFLEELNQLEFNIAVKHQNLQLCKLYILLYINKIIDRDIIILDQPFIKLNKMQISKIINYFSEIGKTLIITSNNWIGNDVDKIFISQNNNYKNLQFDENLNNSVNNDCYSNKVENVFKNEIKNRNYFLHIIIFLILFFIGFISVKIHPVIIYDKSWIYDKNSDLDKIHSKIINDNMDNVYLSNILNPNDPIIICLSQNVKFKNASDYKEYLNEYFNKSTVYKEHAILLEFSYGNILNRTYINFEVHSRPIDTFKNIQLSALISDCLINNSNLENKIKTSIEFQHIDNNPRFNRIIIVDIHLLIITLIYSIVLIKILDIHYNYIKQVILYSITLLILIALEYHIIEIPFNKCLFLPQLIIYSLCCNLKNYSTKKFFIEILLYNSGCFIIYVYYLLNLFLRYSLNYKMNNDILNWIMIILESFSPYNRIVFYKPLAFLIFYMLAFRDDLAKDILNNYIMFYEESKKNTLVSISISLIGFFYWTFHYLYLLRKIRNKKENIQNVIELKKSNIFKKFNKNVFVKDLINVYSEISKNLHLDTIKYSIYSNLSFTLKNKILLSIIGWENICNIKNKEEIEFHFDNYSLEQIYLYINNHDKIREFNNLKSKLDYTIC